MGFFMIAFWRKQKIIHWKPTQIAYFYFFEKLPWVNLSIFIIAAFQHIYLAS